MDPVDISRMLSVNWAFAGVSCELDEVVLADPTAGTSVVELPSGR